MRSTARSRSTRSLMAFRASGWIRHWRLGVRLVTRRPRTPPGGSVRELVGGCVGVLGHQQDLTTRPLPKSFRQPPPAHRRRARGDGSLGVLSGDELRQVLEPATWGVPGPRPTRPPQTVRSLLGVAHACAKHLLPAFGFHECYAELKANAMRGDALTEDELEFVGATSLWHDTSGGWRQFADSAFELDAILSAEDTALLQSLMMVCHADRAGLLA